MVKMVLIWTDQPQQLCIECMREIHTAKPPESEPRILDGKIVGGIVIGSQPAIVDLTSGEAIFEYISATEGDEEMLVLCIYLGWQSDIGD